VPVAEFPKVLEINLIGQDTQCLVGRLLVTQAAQRVTSHFLLYPMGITQAFSSTDAAARGRRLGGNR
jgi:hypothetical protein